MGVRHPVRLRLRFTSYGRCGMGAGGRRRGGCTERVVRDDDKHTPVRIRGTGLQVAGGSDMHVRATMSDDLLSWLPTWKLPLPQAGALWAPVLFHVPPRATRRGGSVGAPLLLLYTESSSCIRERPKLGDQASLALHPTPETFRSVVFLQLNSGQMGAPGLPRKNDSDSLSPFAYRLSGRNTRLKTSVRLGLYRSHLNELSCLWRRGAWAGCEAA